MMGPDSRGNVARELDWAHRLGAVAVRFNRWVPGGMMYNLEAHGGYGAVGPQPPCLVARSETDLVYLLHGVRWHEARDACPTWTDAAGCRCDVESEGQ